MHVREGDRFVIGTVRVEESFAYDSHAGYHQFHSEDSQDPHGSLEVFFDDGTEDRKGGWYWWACFPGCLPDGEASGPFAYSRQALEDADEWNPEFDDDFTKEEETL
jgi:hypothetical protein